MSMADATDKPATVALPAVREPQPELGPAMRALPLRWQKAVTALFLTKGNRSAALRAAGYGAKGNSLHVLASRMFADERMRAAVREVALQTIETSEPELLATTLDIMRDTATRPADRLAAARMVWDRANPVLNKTKIEVEHHLSSDELDVQHYRALQKIGAPQEAFVARFGHNGLARVQAMILAEEAKQKQIESSAGVVDGEYEEAGTTE
jgi:hypothetical protein